MDHGHPLARNYTLGHLHDEVSLIQERVNGRIITENELIKLAIHSLLSKKARTELSKQVKQLNITTEPNPRLF